jgi:peptide/nickel transport system ATP-binding protein
VHAGQRLHAIDGTVPSLAALPQGCAFEPRCSDRRNVCREQMPELRPVDDEQAARCVLVEGRRR